MLIRVIEELVTDGLWERVAPPVPPLRPRRCRMRALALFGLLAVFLPLLVGVGTGPANADTSPYGRKLVVEALADPDVYKVDDNLYFLSGTSSRHLPVDLHIDRPADVQPAAPLRPDQHDSRYDYCHEWAPDLEKPGADYVLYFTASRVAKGASCPSDNSSFTVFYATAPGATNDMQFGAPHEINEGTSYPRTYVTPGCPPDGCDKAMRLDSSVYFDGSRWWMHYTWFDPGDGDVQVISAFPLDAPAQVFEVTRPKKPAEQGVNEAPTLFSRDGRQYLFYSRGGFGDQYALDYFMGAQVTDLTHRHPPYSFSSPLKTHDGRLIENHGHNTVTDRNGQFYTLYHVARFTVAGAYDGRDVYVQPLMFKADGTLNTLNTVTLTWTATAQGAYSLDVQTRDGTWITNCMATGAKSSVTFNEVCTSAGDQVVHKADIATFRINRVVAGVTLATTTLAYDGYTDSLSASV